jgi:hypothetical protein
MDEMLPWYRDFKGSIEKYKMIIKKDYGSKVYEIELMTTFTNHRNTFHDS